MKIYKVGGAVRDKLMGLEPKDTDWVIVGSSISELEKKGFQQVGKDFPVFLHPDTKEEYALARKETKTGKGYKGFKFDFSPDITLEEDLSRRDLTINAIAEDQNGNIIDPHNGQKDIKEKVLRHVSESFFEDPLRALRVARFHAQFNDFIIHPDTENALRKIAKSDELKELSCERVWVETAKSLELQFEKFLKVIKGFNLHNPWFDELTIVPKITSSNPNIKWCQVSASNNFKFAKKLPITNSIKQTLNVWQKISNFDLESGIEIKVVFFDSISSKNQRKIVYEVLKSFPNLEDYCLKILHSFDSINFEYLQNLSSNEISKVKNIELRKILEKNE
tara:strand:- start:3042 stop:4046 length:1005 start_codon:yes stop_codon:yes gene_type:complete